MPRDLTKAEKGKRIEAIRADLREQGIEAEARVFASDDPVSGIVRASSRADLVIIGGAGGGGIDFPFAFSPETEIVDQVACPVLWLREYEERESLLRSLFGNARATKEGTGNGQ